MDFLDEVTIAEHIKKLKAGKKVFSNCYLRFHDPARRWRAQCSAKSILILNFDQGVNRLMFYTTDFEDLKRLEEDALDCGTEYILEIVARDKCFYREELKIMGFELLACLCRVSVKDVTPIFEDSSEIAQLADLSIPCVAEKEDVDRLNDLLWKIFDTRVSHLPDKDQIRQSVKKKEFYIYKDAGQDIKALLQGVAAPRSFYINQVYNGADKKVIHSIMFSSLKRYCEQGGKYVYAWVDERNIASLRFHAKYGMKPDGLFTCVYKYAEGG